MSSLIWAPHEIAPGDTKPGCSVMENFTQITGFLLNVVTQFDGNLDVKTNIVGFLP